MVLYRPLLIKLIPLHVMFTLVSSWQGWNIIIALAPFVSLDIATAQLKFEVACGFGSCTGHFHTRFVGHFVVSHWNFTVSDKTSKCFSIDLSVLKSSCLTHLNGVKRQEYNLTMDLMSLRGSFVLIVKFVWKYLKC